MPRLITALIVNGPQRGEEITVKAEADGSAPAEILLPTRLQHGVNVSHSPSGATELLAPTAHVLSGKATDGQPWYCVKVD